MKQSKIFSFVTYLGWRGTIREFFSVNYGDSGKAEKHKLDLPWGSQKSFLFHFRQLSWNGRRELGNETGESGIFTITDQENERIFEVRGGWLGDEVVQIKFRISLSGKKRTARKGLSLALLSRKVYLLLSLPTLIPFVYLPFMPRPPFTE